MNGVFVDTSFLIAMISPRDQSHSAAIEATKRTSAALITSEYVLLELGNYLCRIPDRETFTRTLAHVKAAMEIVWSDEELFEEGVALFASRADKEWSLTDCLSFVIMRRRGVDNAFTLDHHFVQAGFNVSPQIGDAAS